MDRVTETSLRPSYRSRASEFYGFVAWTTSTLTFVLYILWGLLPPQCIEWFGIYWYPSREWAILLPAWSIMLVITIYVVYSSIAIASTPSFSDMSAITDNYAVFPSASGDHSPYLGANSTSVLYDIPIGLVNRVMYDDLEIEQYG